MSVLSYLRHQILSLLLRYRVMVLRPNAGDLLVLSCSANLEASEHERLLEVLDQLCEQHDCRGILIGPGLNLDKGSAPT